MMTSHVKTETCPMAAQIEPLPGQLIPPSASLAPAPNRLPERIQQFAKFCLVGGSGTLVDMGLLYLLADPKMIGWNIALSKLCAAEIALVNNFIWNEIWTFRSRNTLSPPDGERARVRGFHLVSPRLRRLLFFNAICGVGILFAVLLLHLFHTRLGWNLYLSNLLTIGLVTLWNFGMNAKFNWGKATNVRLPVQKLSILLALALIPIPQTYATGFSASGRMSCVKPAGAAQNVSWVCSFEVSVLDDQWNVTLFETNGQVVLHGCDGKSVYSFLVDPEQEKKLRLQTHVGNVFQGTYPVEGTIKTTMPWLAYCSQDFIARGNTDSDGNLIIPAPWMPAWALPLAHIYKARYTPVSASGGLPARLEFEPDDEAIARLRNGELGSMAAITDSERDRTLVQLAYYSRIPEPEAVYQVTRLTNCGGVVMPAACFMEMYHFGFTNKNNPATKELSWRINCELESVRPIEAIAPLPRHADQIQNISVADYRFFDRSNGVSFLRYTVTNSAWITNRADPFLQQLLSETVASQRAHDFKILPKALGAALLMSLVLCPLLIKQLRLSLRNVIKWIYEN